jgi:hypothetical protein
MLSCLIFFKIGTKFIFTTSEGLLVLTPAFLLYAGKVGRGGV